MEQRSTIIILVLKLGKEERPREAQGHITGQWQSWDSRQLTSILVLRNSPCALESEPLLESGVKVLEEGERPSDLMGNEELLALLRLREEEEPEALL